MARRINRRGFILSSGAGFAAASLAGCGDAPPVADSEMAEGSSMAAGPSFLVGFQSYSMRHFSELDSFLPQAEKLGLGYVELYRGHLATEASPEQIQVVKQSLAGLGIKVNAFGVEEFTADHEKNQALFEFGKKFLPQGIRDLVNRPAVIGLQIVKMCLAGLNVILGHI